MSFYSEICFLMVIVFFSVLCDATVSIDSKLGPKELKEVIKGSSSKAKTYKVKNLTDNKIGGSKEIMPKNNQVEKINSVVNSSVKEKIDSEIDKEIDSNHSKEGSVISGEPKDNFEKKREEPEAVVKEKNFRDGSEQVKDKSVIATQEKRPKLLEAINENNSYEYGDQKSSENVIPKINTSKVEKTERAEERPSLLTRLDTVAPNAFVGCAILYIISDIYSRYTSSLGSSVYELLYEFNPVGYIGTAVAAYQSGRSNWNHGALAPVVVQHPLSNQLVDLFCSYSPNSYNNAHCKSQCMHDISTGIQLFEPAALRIGGVALSATEPLYRSTPVLTTAVPPVFFLTTAFLTFRRFRAMMPF